MGKHGLNTILSMAKLDGYIDHLPADDMLCQFDFAALAALSETLEEVYGPRGGRGIALRIGRATFSRGFKNFGAMAGMADPTFQSLPLVRRGHLGINTLAAVFTKFSDQRSSVLEEDDHYRFVVEISPFAWGRTAERPVCHALAGIIQEGMRWASQGYEYHVYELFCRAVSGSRCTFKVNKTPISVR